MKANPAPMSVADFCKSLLQGSITVNRDYQREENVWNSYMKSYFIESILLGYPIPKIFLYVNYDLKSKSSLKEIVDGQQRSQSLRQFFENKLRISTRIETEAYRGKLYRQLEPIDQQLFLSYSLSIDEFSGVAEEDVREAFTRMNTNNVALNPEELRNARFKGEFKWFVNRIAKAFREPLLQYGLLSRRDIVRMSDLRMFAEFFYIIDTGIETTKSQQIDAMYNSYNTHFPQEDEYGGICAKCVERWLDSGYGDLHQLGRKHIFYTHIAAIAEHEFEGTVSRFIGGNAQLTVDRIVDKKVGIEELDSALSDEQTEFEDHPLREFIEACSAKTNVGHQKLVRYAYLLGALRNDTSI